MTVHKSSYSNPFGLLTIVGNSESVADDGEIVLIANKTGWGSVVGGDQEGQVDFAFDSSGNVTSRFIGGDAAITDTDGKICVYNDGGTVTIKNRLGDTKTVKYHIEYS